MPLVQSVLWYVSIGLKISPVGAVRCDRAGNRPTKCKRSLNTVSKPEVKPCILALGVADYSRLLAEAWDGYICSVSCTLKSCPSPVGFAFLGTRGNRLVGSQLRRYGPSSGTVLEPNRFLGWQCKLVAFPFP